MAMLALFVVLGAAAAYPSMLVAGELYWTKGQEAETIDRALQIIQTEYGRKNYEEHFNGEVVVIRVRQKQSRVASSSETRDIGTFLLHACRSELGISRKNAKGAIVSNPAVGSAGAYRAIQLTSTNGDSYDQEFSPLVAQVVDKIKVSSVFDLTSKSSANDPVVTGGARQSDIVYVCQRYSNDAVDSGAQVVLVVSVKYVDRKSDAYAALVIRGQTLERLFEDARINNVNYASRFAAAKEAERKRRDEERNVERQAQATAEEQQRRQAETFRATLAVGDKTQCGYVIGVRLPMVEVATASGDQWFRVEQLVPATSLQLPCPSNEGSDSKNGSGTQAKQLCEAERATCLATCDSQMTTTDIAAPRMGIMMCRDRCTRIVCQ